MKSLRKAIGLGSRKVSTANNREARTKRASLSSFFKEFGITADTLSEMLVETDGVSVERQRLAAVSALKGERVEDVAALRAAVAQLEERFDRDLDSRKLRGLAERMRAYGANLVSSFLAVSAGYIVVGGLATGQSRLLPHQPLLSLLVFALLIAVLALFEAMHVSATLLQRAKIDALAARYPRAQFAHNMIRREDGIVRFLAGRQVVVIVTVFFTAQLTSFGAMSKLPLTAIRTPAALQLVISWGIPGALVLLWLAQLAPQFIATKRTLWLMNLRVATVATRIAFALESIGITGPGFRLAALVRGSQERVPSAPADRWEHIAYDEVGYATVAVVREISLTPERVSTISTKTRTVRQDNLPAIFDEELIALGSGPSELKSHAYAYSDGQRLPVHCSQDDEERLGGHMYRRQIRPAVGSFPRDTTVRLTLSTAFHSDHQADGIYLDGPARFIMWRVVYGERPALVAPATVRVFVVDGDFDDPTEIDQPITVQPEMVNGTPVIGYRIDFPVPHRLYVLSWEVEW